MAGNRSIINFLVSIKGEQGSTITPQVQDMQGRWAKSSFIRVNPGGNVTLAPEVENEKDGSWAWTGPGNFFAGTREVRLQTVFPTQAGKYTATYTDDYGRQSSIDFTIAVEGTIICPELISYINYGGWKNVSEMEVKEGDSVTFGPHPSNGDWHWEGPDGFTSDRREATVSNFNSQKAGEYIGTFTTKYSSTQCRNYSIWCRRRCDNTKYESTTNGYRHLRRNRRWRSNSTTGNVYYRDNLPTQQRRIASLSWLHYPR